MYYFISTLLFFISVQVSAQQPKPALKIFHLTGDFYVYKTYSKYKGEYTSANAMYLVTKKGVVMFDTPWDPKQFQPLLDSIEKKHHQKVRMLIATHSHEDRAGGLAFYNAKGISTYTSRMTDEILKKENKTRPVFTFRADTTFSMDKYKFQSYYGGEGHTKDNIVIWFQNEKILYGGCLIKSTEAKNLGYTGEANLDAWPATIRRIKNKFVNPRYIITGHDDWTNIKSLDHTLKLLQNK